MRNTPKTAMILAAGLGTRLGTLTSHRPKALLEIDGRSLLEINLCKLEKAGYEKVVVNTHHFHSQIADFVETFRTTMRIELSHEPTEPLETGGGVLKALPLLGETAVLVHNVDVLTDLDLNHLHHSMISNKAAAVLALSHRPSTRQLLFDEEFCLSGWKNTLTGKVRRVGGKRTTYAFAFSAVSLINTNVLKHFSVQRISLIDILLNLSENQKIIGAFPEQSYWFDVGKAEQIHSIETFFREKNFRK